MEADSLVNVATYREDCDTCGCLANLIGLLPGFQKARLMLRGEGSDTISRLVVDLLGAVSPHLSVLIVPARYGGEGEGVVVGVSTDAVALDASFERRVSGSPVPSDVIRFAADAGQGIGWPEVTGEQAFTEIPENLTYVPEKADSRISR